VDIMSSAGADLVVWTIRRFAGAPAAAGCATG
jgi:hypothetical protein